MICSSMCLISNSSGAGERSLSGMTSGWLTDYHVQRNSGCTESVCARPSHTAARPGAKIINVFRAWIGAQLTICAQK